MLTTAIQSHPILIFAGKVPTIRVEFCKVLHSGRLQVFPTNIRLDWKWVEVANTLAYYDTATITAVKSFIVQAPEV